jgi:hypothetical protein
VNSPPVRASFPIVLTAASTLLFESWCRADSNVVISSFANPEYTQRKYGGEKIQAETYVVMQGHYFEAPTVDHSIDRMPFRRIMDFFAPELARREYWPAKGMADADLLIVVHWGTTTRQESADEMRARTSAMTDMSPTEHPDLIAQKQMGDAGGLGALLQSANLSAQQYNIDSLELLTDIERTDLGNASTAQLLGYTRELRKLSNTMGISTTESMLKSDLTSDRYFIILKAYDLRAKPGAGRPFPTVWTLHLNMRSPGINFRSALDRMSAAAPEYFGRATDSVQTVPPHLKATKVEVGAPVIVK